MKTILSNFLLNYLRFWARLRVNRINPKIIGVTGSVGKSSCVYLLSNILSDHYKTKTTYHGNSETGLPLELLDLRDELHDFSYFNWLSIFIKTPFKSLFSRPNWELLIAEMGIDSPYEPKNMAYLLTIIKPDIGIFLNVAPVHTEQFMPVVDSKSDDLEQELLTAIAKEKGLIVTQLDATDYAIVNTDFTPIKQLIPQIKAKVTTIGSHSAANYHLVDYRLTKTGAKFVCFTPTATLNIEINDQFLVKEFSTNILALLATTDLLGLTQSDISQKLSTNLELPPGRQSILKGQKGSTIIDSSYNSSPTALIAHLKMLDELKIKGQKIVCLGDMNELGEISDAEHQKVAKLAANVADVVILVGDQMYFSALPVITKAKPKLPVFAFKTSEGVGAFITDNLLESDDLILIKGSQNRVFLEQVVSDLLIDPKDQSRLARQSNFWDHTRQTYFKKVPNQQLSPDN